MRLLVRIYCGGMTTVAAEGLGWLPGSLARESFENVIGMQMVRCHRPTSWVFCVKASSQLAGKWPATLLNLQACQLQGTLTRSTVGV